MNKGANWIDLIDVTVG